jgi:uncharacterized membrane protein YtjA (UPF0391 family)
MLPMANYATIVLVIALVAGVLGFGIITGTASLIAKACCLIALVLFTAALLRGKDAPSP